MAGDVWTRLEDIDGNFDSSIKHTGHNKYTTNVPEAPELLRENSSRKRASSILRRPETPKRCLSVSVCEEHNIVCSIPSRHELTIQEILGADSFEVAAPVSRPAVETENEPLTYDRRGRRLMGSNFTELSGLLRGGDGNTKPVEETEKIRDASRKHGLRNADLQGSQRGIDTADRPPQWGEIEKEAVSHGATINSESLGVLDGIDMDVCFVPRVEESEAAETEMSLRSVQIPPPFPVTFPQPFTLLPQPPPYQANSAVAGSRVRALRHIIQAREQAESDMLQQQNNPSSQRNRSLNTNSKAKTQPDRDERFRVPNHQRDTVASENARRSRSPRDRFQRGNFEHTKARLHRLLAEQMAEYTPPVRHSMAHTHQHNNVSAVPTKLQLEGRNDHLLSTPPLQNKLKALHYEIEHCLDNVTQRDVISFLALDLTSKSNLQALILLAGAIVLILRLQTAKDPDWLFLKGMIQKDANDLFRCIRKCRFGEVTTAHVRAVVPMLRAPEFNAAYMGSINPLLGMLCNWVTNVVKYLFLLRNWDYDAIMSN